MRIWPAVDLLDGRCVRLYRGRYDEVTEYSRDPAAVAEGFVGRGAGALHVVDLDGAREGRPMSAATVLEIRRRVDVPLQVGGGLRKDEDVQRYLEAGVDRVIVGTGAVRDPEWIARLVDRHGPGAVAAGVDVRREKVLTEGWTREAGVDRDGLLDALDACGVRTVVYTDTTRDGTLTVPDVEGARSVVDRGFRTVVAGGICRPEHVREVREAGAVGAVIGSAIYTGDLELEDALRAAAEGPDGDGRAAREGGGPKAWNPGRKEDG